MVEPAGKMQRIAMATFDDVSRLRSTLEDLAVTAVEPHQLCLIGSAAHVNSLKAGASEQDPPILRGLLDCFRAIALLDNGTSVVAAPAPFDCLDFHTERQPHGLLHDMEEMLIEGVLTLLVLTRTIPEFAAVTRVLLRHSTHRVRTREVPYG